MCATMLRIAAPLVCACSRVPIDSYSSQDLVAAFRHIVKFIGRSKAERLCRDDKFKDSTVLS